MKGYFPVHPEKNLFMPIDTKDFLKKMKVAVIALAFAYSSTYGSKRFKNESAIFTRTNHKKRPYQIHFD